MKTDSENRAVIDTNIIVYSYAENSPKKDTSADLLIKGFKGEFAFFITLQNIGEFCAVASKKYQLNEDKINKISQALLQSQKLSKIHYKNSTFSKAIFLSFTYKVGFWDAMIAATMLENNITTIYTEDEDFSRIEGINAINPFKRDD